MKGACFGQVEAPAADTRTAVSEFAIVSSGAISEIEGFAYFLASCGVSYSFKRPLAALAGSGPKWVEIFWRKGRQVEYQTSRSILKASQRIDGSLAAACRKSWS